MKFVLFFALTALVFTGFASASITPVLSSETGSGNDFTFNYSISVDANEQLAPGNYGYCGGSSSVNCGTFFTIYDFAGYITGTATTTASNWSTSVQLTGVTPNNQIPSDSGSVENITYIYTGTTASGPIVNLGTFSAQSIYENQNALGVFTYQAQKTTGTADQGIGNLIVPENVINPGHTPEPTSLALIGGGLIGLAMLRMKVRR